MSKSTTDICGTVNVPVAYLEAVAERSVTLLRQVVAHCDEVDNLLQASSYRRPISAPPGLPTNVVWLPTWRRRRGGGA